MNKELEISIKSVLHRFLTTEMKYDAATSEIIALCADEAIKAVTFATRYRSCICGRESITEIERRMK